MRWNFDEEKISRKTKYQERYRTMNEETGSHSDNELSAVLHHLHGALPASVPDSDSLAIFKSKLKTHFFTIAHSGL